MMSSLDIVEWIWYTADALLAQFRVDTLKKAKVAHLPML